MESSKRSHGARQHYQAAKRIGKRMRDIPLFTLTDPNDIIKLNDPSGLEKVLRKEGWPRFADIVYNGANVMVDPPNGIIRVSDSQGHTELELYGSIGKYGGLNIERDPYSFSTVTEVEKVIGASNESIIYQNEFIAMVINQAIKICHKYRKRKNISSTLRHGMFIHKSRLMRDYKRFVELYLESGYLFGIEPSYKECLIPGNDITPFIEKVNQELADLVRQGQLKEDEMDRLSLSHGISIDFEGDFLWASVYEPSAHSWFHIYDVGRQLSVFTYRPEQKWLFTLEYDIFTPSLILAAFELSKHPGLKIASDEIKQGSSIQTEVLGKKWAIYSGDGTQPITFYLKEGKDPKKGKLTVYVKGKRVAILDTEEIVSDGKTMYDVYYKPNWADVESQNKETVERDTAIANLLYDNTSKMAYLTMRRIDTFRKNEQKISNSDLPTDRYLARQTGIGGSIAGEINQTKVFDLVKNALYRELVEQGRIL